VLNSGRFDLVILDIQMPQVNGFELCQQLRRMPRYTSVPVIFLSTGVDLQDRAGVVAAGGNDLVLKPVSPLELILKVTMQLLKSSSHNESAMKMANFEPTRGLSIRLTGSREPGAGLMRPPISVSETHRTLDVRREPEAAMTPSAWPVTPVEPAPEPKVEAAAVGRGGAHHGRA
jgi:DNA-binding response OmpR family regulator